MTVNSVTWIKRKYLTHKPVKKNKASGDHQGARGKLYKKRGTQLQPRQRVMVMDSGTGHCVMHWRDW